MSGKIVLLAFVLVLLSLGVVGRFVSADIVGVSTTQEVAPDFTLTDIDGNAFSLGDYRRKVVLLEFFATWCLPCGSETDFLKILNDEFSEKLVTISISPENETILRDFREAHSINWTIARDTANVFRAYNIQYLPTLVIIDQDGYIRYRHERLIEWEILISEIESLLPKTVYVDDDNVAGP
jgi:peroxiredoxin